MYLGRQDRRFMASVLIGYQFIPVGLHPVHRRMKPDSYDDIGIRHLCQQRFRIPDKCLHSARFMPLYSLFIRIIPSRPQPVRIGHQKENLQPGFSQAFNILRLMETCCHSHGRISPSVNHQGRTPIYLLNLSKTHTLTLSSPILYSLRILFSFYYSFTEPTVIPFTKNF